MNVNKLLRLCSRLTVAPCRRYSENAQKGVLRIAKRGMFADIFPNQSMDEMHKLVVSNPQVIYAGFDPTAESLHIGNLIVLMNLLHWQRFGHQVIAVVGGATGTIGDPSHRTTERMHMHQSVLEQNLDAIKNQIQNVFENHSKYVFTENTEKLKPVIILNNLAWYKNVNIIDFIKTYGKCFRLGTMLGRSAVESRLNSDTGLSFAEFTYSILQAYDWYFLAKEYNCRFQIGGNDQMGNIVSGHDLIGRILNTKVYGITMPLLTAKSGQKLGKSAGNALWLCPSKSSSFEFYQYFIRVEDVDVERFLKLFTFIPLSEIDEIMKEHREKPEARKAQKILATHVTILVHGRDGLETAKRTSAALYDNSIDSIAQMSAKDMVKVFQDANLVELTWGLGMTVYQLALKAKCFKYTPDAEKIILAGGFYVNHQRITNLEEVLVPGIHILSNNVTLIRVGKKTYHIVKWV